MNLGLNSYEFLDFHLGFCGMNFQITNSRVVELLDFMWFLRYYGIVVKKRMLGF